MGSKATKSLGLGVLSWNAHETLKRSLETYPKDFLDIFDQRLVYFSDISDEDHKIADHYGWEYAGAANEGIAGGMKRLAENMRTDYVLLLQNDNPLVESPEFAATHLREAVALLDSGKADLGRMRHRWQVGEGFCDSVKYLKYYGVRQIAANFIESEHSSKPLNYADGLKKRLNRILKPHNARRFRGRSIFIEDNPEEIYPDYIQRQGGFLIVDSSVLDFTDQCLLISRQKWLEVFVPFVEANPSCRRPNGFQAPEICINSPWWRESGFKILQGQGLFSHARYDGSFRAEHHTNRI